MMDSLVLVRLSLHYHVENGQAEVPARSDIGNGTTAHGEGKQQLERSCVTPAWSVLKLWNLLPEFLETDGTEDVNNRSDPDLTAHTARQHNVCKLFDTIHGLFTTLCSALTYSKYAHFVILGGHSKVCS
jgi:hypothetical protein